MRVRLPALMMLAALAAGPLNAAAAVKKPAAKPSAIANPANRISAQPVGGDAPVSGAGWGVLEQMIDPIWYTEGLAVQRMSTVAWSVPGKVLIIRHGPTERLKLGAKYADIVQRIERNPNGSFTILYSYEDGHTLSATGAVEADGTFVETIKNPDGSIQRNRYVLDNDRKMRIIRQKPQGTGWANISIAVKNGETRAERQAKLDAIAAQRAAEQAQRDAEEAQQRAEREQQQAEDDARYAQEQAEEEAERDAQRQRNWDALQNMQQQAQQQAAQSEANFQRFLGGLREQEARKQEAARQAAEAARQAAERQRQLQAQQQQAQIADARNAQAQQQAQQRAAQAAAEAERARQAALAAQQQQARQAQQAQIAQANQQRVQQQQQQQQQAAEQQRRQQEADAKRAAETAIVSWKEGVTLCEPPKNGGSEWACHGPLQTTYGVLEKPSGNIAISQACGNRIEETRELGQSGGFRIFGCGFGIHPSPNMRDYPGQGDPAERYGVFVPGRTTYSCPKNQTNPCKRRN